MPCSIFLKRKCHCRQNAVPGRFKQSAKCLELFRNSTDIYVENYFPCYMSDILWENTHITLPDEDFINSEDPYSRIFLSHPRRQFYHLDDILWKKNTYYIARWNFYQFQRPLFTFFVSSTTTIWTFIWSPSAGHSLSHKLCERFCCYFVLLWLGITSS